MDPKKKRKQQNSIDLSSDDDVVQTSDKQTNSTNVHFPRFLVVTAKDNQPIKLSIFGIQKLVSCAIGDVKEAKKLRNGTVLLEVKTQSQADKALSMSAWVDQEVQITAHRSLNTSRGIIRCREFRDSDDVEILNALGGQGVTAVKRLTVNRNGNIEPTNTFVLTFALPTIPSAVKAAYMRIPVELYIPNPLRCFQCQMFGHGKSTCRRKQVCAKCSQEGHLDTECTNGSHCANCAGTHPAYSRDCIAWKTQREITRVKFEQNLPFGEAKKLVEHGTLGNTSNSNVPHARRAGVSYAAASQQHQQQQQQQQIKITHSIAIQTDYTWPLDATTPVLCSTSHTFTAAAQTDEIAAGSLGAVSTQSIGSTPAASIRKPSVQGVGGPSAQGVAKATAGASPPKVGDRQGPKSMVRPSTSSSKGSEKAVERNTVSNRSPKGSGDLIKLSNRYNSMDEMDMDLGGASCSSSGKGKRK
jgi:hypothetical protein